MNGGFSFSRGWPAFKGEGGSGRESPPAVHQQCCAHMQLLCVCSVPLSTGKTLHKTIYFYNAGGDSKTLMVVQIAPVEKNVGETVCSLNFAQRVRAVELGQATKRIVDSATEK